jgi:hypothetical protein
MFLCLPGRSRRSEAFGEQLEDLKQALATALTEVGNYKCEVSRQREASPEDTLTKAASTFFLTSSIPSGFSPCLKIVKR